MDTACGTSNHAVRGAVGNDKFGAVDSDKLGAVGSDKFSAVGSERWTALVARATTRYAVPLAVTSLLKIMHAR